MLKIALVDDSLILRSAIKNVLEASGYEVPVEAGNSKELFEQLHQHMVQAVLLDVFFPGENGLDILTELKNRYPQMKVLLVTGIRKDNVLAEAQKRGACGVLYKPFDTDDLLSAIRRLSSE